MKRLLLPFAWIRLQVERFRYGSACDAFDCAVLHGSAADQRWAADHWADAADRLETAENWFNDLLWH